MFTNGVYAQNAFEAGMLGYVQDGSIDDWASKIENKLAKHHLLAEERIWIRKTTIADFKCYCSRHERATIGTPITILHILLPFQ